MDTLQISASKAKAESDTIQVSSKRSGSAESSTVSGKAKGTRKKTGASYAQEGSDYVKTMQEKQKSFDVDSEAAFYREAYGLPQKKRKLPPPEQDASGSAENSATAPTEVSTETQRKVGRPRKKRKLVATIEEPAASSPLRETRESSVPFSPSKVQVQAGFNPLLRNRQSSLPLIVTPTVKEQANASLLRETRHGSLPASFPPSSVQEQAISSPLQENRQIASPASPHGNRETSVFLNTGQDLNTGNKTTVAPPSDADKALALDFLNLMAGTGKNVASTSAQKLQSPVRISEPPVSQSATPLGTQPELPQTSLTEVKRPKRRKNIEPPVSPRTRLAQINTELKERAFQYDKDYMAAKRTGGVTHSYKHNRNKLETEKRDLLEKHPELLNAESIPSSPRQDSTANALAGSTTPEANRHELPGQTLREAETKNLNPTSPMQKSSSAAPMGDQSADTNELAKKADNEKRQAIEKQQAQPAQIMDGASSSFHAQPSDLNTLNQPQSAFHSPEQRGIPQAVLTLPAASVPGRDFNKTPAKPVSSFTESSGPKTPTPQGEELEAHIRKIQAKLEGSLDAQIGQIKTLLQNSRQNENAKSKQIDTKFQALINKAQFAVAKEPLRQQYAQALSINTTDYGTRQAALRQILEQKYDILIAQTETDDEKKELREKLENDLRTQKRHDEKRQTAPLQNFAQLQDQRPIQRQVSGPNLFNPHNQLGMQGLQHQGQRVTSNPPVAALPTGNLNAGLQQHPVQQREELAQPTRAFKPPIPGQQVFQLNRSSQGPVMNQSQRPSIPPSQPERSPQPATTMHQHPPDWVVNHPQVRFEIQEMTKRLHAFAQQHSYSTDDYRQNYDREVMTIQQNFAKRCQDYSQEKKQLDAQLTDHQNFMLRWQQGDPEAKKYYFEKILAPLAIKYGIGEVPSNSVPIFAEISRSIPHPSLAKPEVAQQQSAFSIAAQQNPPFSQTQQFDNRFAPQILGQDQRVRTLMQAVMPSTPPASSIKSSPPMSQQGSMMGISRSSTINYDDVSKELLDIKKRMAAIKEVLPNPNNDTPPSPGQEELQSDLNETLNTLRGRRAELTKLLTRR